MPTASTAPDEQAAGLLSGVALLRLAVLVWAAVVVAVDLNGATELHAAGAVTTLVALGVWTSLVAGQTVRRRTATAPWLVPADMAIAAAVAAMDHLVYEGPHPQTFGSSWPLGAVVTAGILRGRATGGAAGAAVGLSGALGIAVFRDGGLSGQWLSSAGTFVLLVVAGVLAGVVTDALRQAEATAARARAREEFARDLHDGVLQTLAVVQRRSTDAELAALARDQELQLRRFIGDQRASTQREVPDLATALREVAAERERRDGLRCEVVVVEPLEWLDASGVEALRGAVGEALTNAHRHGRAERAVVCVDEAPDGAGLCTVDDDGAGFDVECTPEGVGLSRSIRGRLEEVGGDATVSSSPGRGCEVVLRVPRGGRSRRS
jgi:signal transduction histidine kinase